MSEYGAAGITRGARVGLDQVRTRRYQAEQDRLAEEERQRRHEREDFNFAQARKQASRNEVLQGREDVSWRQGQEDRDYQIGRRDIADERSDTLYEQGQEDREHTLGRRDTLEAREDTTYRQSQEDREYTLRRRDTLEDREDTTYRQSQEDRARTLERDETTYQQQQADRQTALAQMETEGLKTLAQSLREGADPDLALRRFNATGEWRIDPGQFSYDRNSGILEFTDSDGDRFSGTLDEFSAAVGLVSPTETGKDRYMEVDDRIFDTRDESWITPPGGVGGGAGGRNLSTYNPQTVQQNITGDIVMARGGEMDVLGRWGMADASERAVVNEMIAVAHDMEGRLRNSVISGQLTAGEISNAVIKAFDGYKPDSQIQEEAQAWATKGFNRSDAERQQWIDAATQERDAQIRLKLAAQERALLGQATSPSVTRPATPAVGTVMQGDDGSYRFTGGDPSDQSNWERVQTPASGQ